MMMMILLQDTEPAPPLHFDVILLLQYLPVDFGQREYKRERVCVSDSIINDPTLAGDRGAANVSPSRACV